MGKQHNLLITPEEIVAVYSDDLREIFEAFGKPEIERATHVEYNNFLERWVIYSPNGKLWRCYLCMGTRLSDLKFPPCPECDNKGYAMFTDHQHALDYEYLMLDTHLSEVHDNPSFDPMNLKAMPVALG